MYEYPFEKLKVWQNARTLSADVLRTFHKITPKEKFGITPFIVKAAMDVSKNIATGNWKSSTETTRESVDNSHGALMCLLCHIIIAHDLDVIDNETYSEIREKINDLSIMLLAFKKSLNNRDKKTEEAVSAA